MTSFVAIIQARMSSSRLPGKSLLPFGKSNLLQHQINVLSACPKLDLIIVATSDHQSDQAIADYCEQMNIECFRGPLDNVAQRFYLAIKHYKPDVFARFCADRPFYDWRILDQAYKNILSTGADICTNVTPATFPKGQTTEVIKANLYLETFHEMQETEDLEHVTRYFYQNKECFQIENITSDTGDHADINLCIDTKEDYDRAIKILGLMSEPYANYSYQDIIKFYRQVI
ncbi:MAG: NTP transferase domain-containing protein [Bdellovibrionota bacterium]